MTSTASKKILVLGATGVIGKVLVNALINAKGNVERVGIFTSAETVLKKKDLVALYQNQGVDVITGDLYNDNDMLDALKGSYPTLLLRATPFLTSVARLQASTLSCPPSVASASTSRLT